MRRFISILGVLILALALLPVGGAVEATFDVPSPSPLTQSYQGGGSPAYQVLIPHEIGSETGLQVFPPKLQDGGEKDNWLAVQSPDGLDVALGNITLYDKYGNVTANTSIYIDSGTLVIGAYALSDKCPKPIEIDNYTLSNNDTRAQFRSYVYGSGSDTYELEDAPQIDDPRHLPILSVTIKATVRGTVSGSTAATRINTATKKYNGNEVALGISGDTEISTVYTLNPNTNLAWTWSEINSLEAGVTLKNSAQCSYVYALVKTEVHSQTFFPIDRVSLTLDNSGWQDVDVTPYLPSGATGVIVHVYDTSTVAAGARKNGSTDTRTTSLQYQSQTWFMIGVDSSRIFEVYKVSSSIYYYLVGYTMTGVTFFTNAYDKSLGSTGSWIDIDCSSEASGADGLIFEVIGGYANPCPTGFRMNGSSDNRLYQGWNRNPWSVVIGCDGSEVIEGYIGTTNTDYYLVGYITDGCTFNTNATDLSLGSTGTWTDLSALPSGAVMGFIEVGHTGQYNYDYGLRANGSSDDFYHDIKCHSWGIIDCDDSQLIEGKIEDTATDFWLVGYATGGVRQSLDVIVDTGSDDACENYNGNGMDLVGSLLVQSYAGIFRYVTGARLTDSGFPETGATITSAYIEVWCDNAVLNDLRTNIYCEDKASPPTFGSASSNITNRTWTSAYVAWDYEDMGTSGYTTSPSVIAPLQEIFDSYSPSAVVIIIDGRYEGASSWTWSAYSQEDYSGARAPKLHMEWIEAGCSVSISVSPSGYSFGVIAASSTPSTSTSYFTIDNDSTCQTDQTIRVTTSTWSGGVTWTHSDTATPGANQAGLKANKGGTWGVGDVIIKYNATYNFIAENQAASTDYSFGLKLWAPTSFGDAVPKSIVVRISAVEG